MKQLTIIDGNSLLFRAYFASIYGGSAPLTSQHGVPTNAVFVFANMLHKIIFPIQNDQEKYLLVAFDTGKKTFRHEQLDTYKAHRKPVPEDLIPQFAIVRELLKALQIFTFELDGFEGDDIAGTMAIRAKQAGFNVDIYTSDRDFLQLCQDHIDVKLIKKGVTDIVTMTPEKVLEVYGIHPHQVPDYKGLVGDASDNIPGIPGIGDKTAVKLLQTYGNFDAIIQAAPTIKGKMGENLLQHQALGQLSKELAIIQTSMDLPFQVEDTLYRGINEPLLKQFIQDYGMKSLADRYLKAAPVEQRTWTVLPFSSFPTITKGELTLVPIIEEGNYFKKTLQGWMIGYQDHVYHVDASSMTSNAFRSLLAQKDIALFVYDSKQVYVLLKRLFGDVPSFAFDVKLATLTLDETPSLSTQHIFAQAGVELAEDLLQRSTQMAATLSSMVLPLKTALKEKQLEDIVYTIEFPLASVLADMELEGIDMDGDMLKSMAVEVEEKINALKLAMQVYAPEPINFDSPKQVSELLFTTLQLPNLKKGSTNVEVLKALSDAHPIIPLLLDYRKLSKMLSTYLLALPEHLYEDGKLHPLYHQVQTTTGRLSSYDPNIQNISVKDDETKRIRQAFYVKGDWTLLSFDYSQIELRILAELSQCKPLLADFASGKDIHTATAERLFAAGGEVTSSMRRQAKAVNFGIIYGISSWGLAEQLNIAPQEASQLIEQFYQAYPELRTYMQKTIEQLHEQQYVSTLLGRRRYLRDIKGGFQAREFAKRAAMNAPIQGTAADLLKLAMIQVAQFLKDGQYQTKLIATIHDELLFRCYEPERETIMPQLQAIMENAMTLRVPLKVEGAHAPSWYALK